MSDVSNSISSSAPAGTTVTNGPTATSNTSAQPEAPKAPAAEGGKAAEQKQPTAAEIRRMKLKLDGADLELPEEEVIKLAQMGGSAQKKFQEASALRKQAEQVLEFITQNPREALERLGIDVRRFSEETVAEFIKRDAESPEQKKLREQEEKLRTYEQKEKEREEAERKKAEEVAEAEKKRIADEKQRQIMEKYDTMFTKALDESGLPKNAYTVKRMAELQRVNLKKGLDLDASSLAKIVREDYDAEFKHRLPRDEKGGLLGEKLIEMFGEDVIKAITRAQIAKLKSAKQKFSSPAPETEPTAKKEPGLSWRELQKRNRGRSA